MTTNDRTVFRPRESNEAPPKLVGSSLLVRFQSRSGQNCHYEFDKGFIAGRDEAASDLVLKFDNVSRRHFFCRPERDGWSVEDLGSANGLYVVGANNQVSEERVTREYFRRALRLRVGVHGPLLDFSCSNSNGATSTYSRSSSSPSATSPTEFIHRYFGDNTQGAHDGAVIRAAVDRIAVRRTRKYKAAVAASVALVLCLVAALTYKQWEVNRLEQTVVQIADELDSLKSTASQLFYEMRRTAVQASSDPTARTRLAAMETQYDEFLDRLGFDYSALSEEEQLVLKVARVFGECELEMPRDFLAEVKRYIGIWQRSDRLKSSIQRAERNGYVTTIKEKLVENYLPPQFFYIGLQESAFDDRAIGPSTRWGIAKGIWQFIPDTASRYGLKIGPLREQRAYDRRDERFDFVKATDAAARYLSDIYSTEAQASGLLVVASYNWGENRVRKRVRELPNHPEERNFWNFLKHHEMPAETRDYVLRIFSAAVIGENPALFGFDFENPLRNSG